MKDPRDIIKRPIITERTADMMNDLKYVFEVDIRANKTEIKQAVESIFKVKVANVNTLRVPINRSAMAATPDIQPNGRKHSSRWRKTASRLNSSKRYNDTLVK